MDVTRGGVGALEWNEARTDWTCAQASAPIVGAWIQISTKEDVDVVASVDDIGDKSCNLCSVRERARHLGK